MKKFIENNICNLRLLLMVVFVVYGMMQQITIFGFICNNHTIPFIMLFLGALILLFDLITKKRMFSGKYVFLLLSFVAITFVSAVLNIKYGIYGNIVALAYLAIELFVIYPFLGYKATAKRDFKIISYVASVFSFLLSVYTIISYLFYLEYSYVPPIEKGNVIEQGYQSIYRRAWGFYCETNWQGITAVIVIFLCLYLIKSTKIKAVKAWNVFNIIYHIVILVLSGSRSSTLALYGAFSVWFWFISKKCTKKFNFSLFKEQSIRIIAGLLGALISFTVISSTKLIMPKIQVTVRRHISSSARITASETIKAIYSFNNIDVTFKNLGDGKTDFEDIKEEKIERLDIESKDDKFNGRVYIWLDAVKVWVKTPVFGTSPANYAEFAADKTPHVTQEILYGQSMRNGYLQLLLQSGIIGFAVMAIFLVLCFTEVFKHKYKKNGYCFEIGCTVGIITALCIFILFSSDLFYVRSGLTYIFWISIGFGMYLLEEDKTVLQPEGELFICDTPYQIVNSVSLAKQMGHSDIYIYDQFSSAKQIAENLKKTDIFDNVAVINKYKTYPTLLNKAVTFFKILFPNYTFKRHCRMQLSEKAYRRVYVSFFTAFTDTVRLCNPQSQFIQYEDGIGSYYIDDLENRFRSRIYKWVNKYLLNGRLSYNINVLYLCHPECYDGIGFNTVEKIEKFKNTETLKKIFDYKENGIYKNMKCIYLSQPLSETSLGEKALSIEKEILRIIQNNALIRIHPRQSIEEYAEYSIDNVGNLWELECAEQIKDSHVLIGAFSTAQFTPKMLFDKEPTVIFTYKLYGNLFTNAEITIEKLRAMYKNPEKIIVAENLEELQNLSVKFGDNIGNEQ